MNQKRVLIGFSLLLLGVLLVSCSQSAGQVSGKDIWDTIIKLGSLEYFGLTGTNAVVSFMRVLVAILIFAILFEVSGLLNFARNVRIALAVILSVISSIFIPAEVLAGIGAAYATLISFVLIGTPLIAGLVAYFNIPHTTRGWIAIRMVILLLLLWILLAVKHHASAITGLS